MTVLKTLMGEPKAMKSFCQAFFKKREVQL